jgi:hypothetical protein
MKFGDSFHPYYFLCCLYLLWFYAGCWYLYFVFFRMAQFLFIFASNRMRVGIILSYVTFGSVTLVHAVFLRIT